MKNYKPGGYNSLSPYFIVKGAPQFIALMEEIFDAKQTRLFTRPDGSIVHAEVRLDDSIIMLTEATEQFPPVPMVIHVYVPNVDETFERVKKAGCKILEAPQRREGDPDRRGTFLDHGNNTWSIATQISES